MAKKRLQTLCILIIMAMVATIVPAQATSLLYDTMPLKEKLAMQIEAGSGFSYSVEVAGKTPDEPWLLDGLKDEKPLVVEGTFIKDGKNNKAENAIVLKSGGKNLLDANITTEEKATHFSSESLETDVTIPQSWEKALLAYIFTPDSLDEGFDQLLTAYQFLTGIMEKANESLEPYRKEIDFWLQQYAQEPIAAEDGSEGFRVDFQIPPQGIKAGIKGLLDNLLQEDDENSGETTEGVLGQLIEKSPNPQYAQEVFALIKEHYGAILDQITFPEDLVFSRTFKTFGVLEKTTLILPLSQSFFGFSLLTITYDEKGQVDVAFSGPAGEMGFSYTKVDSTEKEKTINGKIFYYPVNAADKIFALSYTLALTQKATDEKGLIEEYDFSLLAVPLWKDASRGEILSLSQKAQYWLKENLEVTGSFQLISESSKSKPVEIKGTADVSGLQFLAAVTFEGRSQGPWEIKGPSLQAKQVDIKGLSTLKTGLYDKVVSLLAPITLTQDVTKLPSMETAEPKDEGTGEPTLAPGASPSADVTASPVPSDGPTDTPGQNPEVTNKPTDEPIDEPTPKEEDESEGITFY